MAKVTDLAGIKQIIQPLEESGTLVRRSDEEVCAAPFDFCMLCILFFYDVLVGIRTKVWSILHGLFLLLVLGCISCKDGFAKSSLCFKSHQTSKWKLENIPLFF